MNTLSFQAIDSRRDGQATEIHALKTTSASDRVKKTVRKIMVPVKGSSLISLSVQSGINIAACCTKLSTPLRIALAVVKIPASILDVLSSIATSCEIHRKRKTASILTKALKECSPKAPPEQKAAAMQPVLHELKTIGKIGHYCRKLNFSRGARIAIKESIRHLQAHVTAGTVSDEDLLAIRTLAGRIHLDIGYQIANTVNSCICIAVAILILAPVPVAAQLTSAILFTASAVTTFVLWVIRETATNRNPFDPSSHCLAITWINSIVNKLHIIPRHIRPSALAS